MSKVKGQSVDREDGNEQWLDEAGVQWLRNKLRETVEKLRVRLVDDPGGTVVYTPGGYGADGKKFWVRDCFYIVHGASAFVPVEEIRAIVRLVLRFQRPDGMVPKNCTGKSGDYGCWGPPPESDSAQFVVLLAYEYFRRTGDATFASETVSALQRAMDSMPRDDRGLVWIDPANPRTAYGFTDQVVKTGAELFCSLLYWEASRKLAEMALAAGEMTIADEMSARAARIGQTLPPALWDEEAGMYLAASQEGRQMDIWGSAYAVYIGFPGTERSDRICRHLCDRYPEIVFAGQVRHLPGGEYWSRMNDPCPRDDYQNGAFWGTASGWVAYAIARLDPALASRMLRDLVEDYRRDDACEWINKAGVRRIPGYGASVANPMAALDRLRAEGNVFPS